MSKKVAASAAAVGKPQGPINFLCLHGHAMTGAGFEKKVGSIRSEVKKLNCNFFFPTGPIDSPPDWFAGGAPAAPPQQNAQAPVETTSSTTATDSPPSPVVAVPSAADVPKSWMDFWSAKKAQEADGAATINVSDPKSIFPYTGVPASLKLLSECTLTNLVGDGARPAIDGHFAFSQGTVLSVIWLAIAMRQIRLEVEAALVGANGAGEANTQSDAVVAEEDLPLDEWRLPPHMLLLKETLPASASACGDAAANGCAHRLIKPFLVVVGSGLVPRDEVFGPFVRKEALAYGKLLQHLKELNTSSVEVVEGHHIALRPVVSLHCFGEGDDLIQPAMSKGLVDLFRTASQGVEVAGKEGNDYETTPVAGSQPVSVWSHEGGHVMPAPFRKPFKQFVQSVAGSF